ncbi:MAG: Mrp/NBP35 family ATP-binding protein [Myxococcota bacterium]
MSEFSNLKEKIKQREAIEENLKEVKHRLVVMSGKGGVGKSTITASLGTAFVHLGFSVGIVDSDMHGPSIPKILGVDKLRGTIQGDENFIYPLEINKNLRIISLDLLIENKDTPIIWRGPLKMKMITDFLEKVKWGSLDFLLFDLPPGTGDEPLSIAQTLPSNDGVIIVTTPQEVALHSVRKSIKFAQDLKMPVLGIIENMSSFICPHCNNEVDIFGKGTAKNAADDFGIRYFGEIPIDPQISKRGDSGEIPDFNDKNSITTQRFLEIAESIVEILNKNANRRFQDENSNRK